MYVCKNIQIYIFPYRNFSVHMMFFVDMFSGLTIWNWRTNCVLSMGNPLLQFSVFVVVCNFLSRPARLSASHCSRGWVLGFVLWCLWLSICVSYIQFSFGHHIITGSLMEVITKKEHSFIELHQPFFGTSAAK